MRSSPKRICGFIAPTAATTSPLVRSVRCAAMVVEPTSIATPKARSAKPGMMATMSRLLRSATVTFHCPARNALCKPTSVARSACVSPNAPLLVQRLLEATKITGRLVHVRLGDLDVIEADDRIDLDRMGLRALADDLPVDLAFGRHVDDEIAAIVGLAAEP